ncbi:hypothetical protein [Jatrophihabitans sp.]|uniref:hypothetical protein n=1 Tax=Jatrophihabitans sp. TaxID=1932789 RepID=UPI002BE038EE|nr:hypothetical protein [Jatrophihabitans sp.]
MTVAALVTWLLAALVGAYLLRTWLVNGGLRRNEPQQSRFSPYLILGHAGLAATGLAVWIAFMAAGGGSLAWVAVTVLVLVATLGFTMFGLWIRAGHGLPRGRHAFVPRHAAEDHFPPPAVLAHGSFAVATVLLVLFTAIS